MDRNGTLGLVLIRTINIERLVFQIDLFHLGLKLLGFLGNKPYDLVVVLT